MTLYYHFRKRLSRLGALIAKQCRTPCSEVCTLELSVLFTSIRIER
jgi:hypothetical protein